MKKTFSILLAFVILNSVFAGDFITLTNNKTIEGKVTKIKDCTVQFKVDKQKFYIPAEDILVLKFENVENKIYKDYLNKIALVDGDACLSGRNDGKQYHGKKVKHIVIGALFGIFGVAGTAIGNPKPFKANQINMLNKDLSNNAEYLKCYKKGAKGKNLTMSAIGMLGWFLIISLTSN